MSRRSLRRSLAGVVSLALVAGLTWLPAAGAATTTQRSAAVKLVRQTSIRTAVKASSARVTDSPFAADLAEAKADIRKFLERFDSPSKNVGDEGGNSLYAYQLPTAASLPVGGGVGAGETWEGLNHFNSRYAGGGNAFSGEPADLGVCASNSHVLEIVNSVVQVYDDEGNALIGGTPFFPGTAPIGLTLNEFYGVAPSFVRPDGPFGLFMFDVSCLFDASTGRWFVSSSALSQDPVTGAFDGPAYTYLAVSTSANPLGGWRIYVLDNTNNGENGTPDHGCSSGFCFGDYPQIGMDANGFYVATNEFDNLGAGEFHGAQLYAFSKADLIAGDPTPRTVYLENVQTESLGDVAYTTQPVNARPAEWDRSGNGTMYFGMSASPFTNSGASNRIVLYALRNTGSLNGTPALTLHEAITGTQKYVVPFNAEQKYGPTPLLNCINRGVTCYGENYSTVRAPHPIDTGSGKVYGAWLHDGVVYLTTSTALKGTGAARINPTNGSWVSVKQRVGVAYFALDPSWSGGLSIDVTQQGYAAVAGNNLSYPSIAIGPDGEGAIGATLVGPGYYPAAAFVPFTAGEAPTSVQVPSPGVGPSDGFTGVAGYYRARWGDYGAAAVSPDGHVWLAAQSIEQSCTFAEWSLDTTCGYTRTFLANWSTRIVEVTT
ncbi:MAG TPA: hypothetical protein VF235_06495 [Actinomycetota bacterium]